MLANGTIGQAYIDKILIINEQFHCFNTGFKKKRGKERALSLVMHYQSIHIIHMSVLQKYYLQNFVCTSYLFHQTYNFSPSLAQILI
jgi:hypothetical protein